MSDQMDKMESTQEIGTERTAKEKRAEKAHFLWQVPGICWQGVLGRSHAFI